MNLTFNAITEAEELQMQTCIASAMSRLRARPGDHRSRILRYGWDYVKPTIWRIIPEWVWIPRAIDRGDFDNISINEYQRGQAITPHIDSEKFGDVYILSLLADSVMRFTSQTGEAQSFALPRRSLAVMSGELRRKWRHETLPLESDLRYSVVYRRKIE